MNRSFRSLEILLETKLQELFQNLQHKEMNYADERKFTETYWIHPVPVLFFYKDSLTQEG